MKNYLKKVQKRLTTPIRGRTLTNLLLLITLGITMGSCTLLSTQLTKESTSEENTFGKNESLELKVVLPNGEELHLKATGKNTMVLVLTLKQMLNSTGQNPLRDLY